MRGVVLYRKIQSINEISGLIALYLPPLNAHIDMNTQIFRFIALTFGISWLIAIVLYLQGIPYNSYTAKVLITLFYLPAPAIATLILSYLDKQSILPYIHWEGIRWRQILWLPFIFLGFVIASFAIVYLLGNVLNITGMGVLEWSEGSVQYRLALFSHGTPNYSKPIPLGSLWLFLSGVGTTILAGFTLNALKSFVEELGWRGYLYEQTRQWGFLKSSVFIGLVVGVWYVPLILLGMNFPTQPIAGMGLMFVACIVASILLTAVRIRTASVLGAAILSGMLRGCAMLFFVYIVGGTELFASQVGIAGIGGMLVVVAVLLATNYARPTSDVVNL